MNLIETAATGTTSVMKRIGAWTILAGLLVSAGLATSCDSEDEELFCDARAYPSVLIDVVDSSGETVLLEPGSVTYTIDGGELRTVADEFGVVESPVNIFGSSGEHVVTVAPEGYEPGVVTADVGLTDDGCHVVTEERELVLDSIAQGAETG